MAIFVGNNDKEYKRVPVGLHVGVLYMLVDMGLQRTVYQGQERWRHKLYLRWETPEEKEDDGRPLSIGLFVGANLSPKGNLRPMLEAWRGRPFTEEELKKFDVAAVLGKACQINVTHTTKDGKTYENITSVVPLSKGMTAPKATNTLIKYGPDDTAQHELLPDWIKKKLAEGRPVGSAPAPTVALEADDSSDIPF